MIFSAAALHFALTSASFFFPSAGFSLPALTAFSMAMATTLHLCFNAMKARLQRILGPGLAASHRPSRPSRPSNASARAARWASASASASASGSAPVSSWTGPAAAAAPAGPRWSASSRASAAPGPASRARARASSAAPRARTGAERRVIIAGGVPGMGGGPGLDPGLCRLP